MRFAPEIGNTLEVIDVATFAGLLEVNIGREQKGRRGNRRSAFFPLNCELNALCTL